jgi:hypothetical protein
VSATIKSEIPGGAIQSQRVDQDVADYLAGRPVAQRVVLSVVQLAGVTVENQQAGRVNKAKYETVHMAEVRDPHEKDQYRHRITQLRADQGLEVSQPALFAATDAEQASGLIDLINDHARKNDIDNVELNKLWLDAFGAGHRVEGLPEHMEDCRAPQLLKEFAYKIGAIKDSPVRDPDEQPTEDGDEGRDDSTIAEQTQPAAAAESDSAVGGVPFTEVTEQ